MLRSVTIIILSAILVMPANAQDLKELENKDFYAAKRVASRSCKEVLYKDNLPLDTLLISVETFDVSGKLMTTEFYSPKGEKTHVIEYGYDTKGQLNRNILYIASQNWQGIELRLEFDNKHLLRAREIPESVQGFWKRQEFQYDATNHLLSAATFFDSNGKLILYKTEHFENLTEMHENSLSHIYDRKGLLIVEQLYKEEIADRAKVYDYCFHRKGI